MLCDITCVLEFVGDDVSAADVKHMIWRFQNAGVIALRMFTRKQQEKNKKELQGVDGVKPPLK